MDLKGAAGQAPARIACFFSTSGHSGVDRAMGNLIPALARRGYPVDQLKVRRHGPDLGEHSPPGVSVIDLGSHHTLACLPAVVAYLRRHRPAVMLSDKDRVNRVALFARFLARVPVRLVLRSGMTISGDLAERGPLERWVQRTSMGRLYRLADQVIVPSVGAADDMAEYTGLPRGHIRVVPTPIIPASLLEGTQPRPTHPWIGDPTRPLILSVGELSGRKDFETLIRAFALVRARRPCRLMILGRGRACDRLLALATALGVAEDLTLPGFVPEPYGFLAHADLFAFSSRREGLGMALVEALAAGTAAVSTDCPSGPREVLQGGRFGPLVPVGDHHALAEAILATLDSPLPREHLKAAARRYEIESATDAYLSVFGLAPEAADAA